MRRFAIVPAVLIALSAPTAAQTTVVSPGNCGWLARADPLTVNVLYPDEDAVYYLAAIPGPPPGLAYRIRGEFPYGRYSSFVAYDGLPIDAVLDTDYTTTDPGAPNPFVAGSSRLDARRGYVVPLTVNPAEDDAETLFIGAGQLGVGTPAPYLLYRIYVPDRGTGFSGGVGLPQIELVAEGAELDLEADAIPCEGVREAMFEAGSPVGESLKALGFPVRLPVPVASTNSQPATNPPTWKVQSGLTTAVVRSVDPDTEITGGPGSNPHNQYVASRISQAFGEVAVIRAKAPTAPATQDGAAVMGSGELRYWSICQNSTTTRFVACLIDEDVVQDDDGWFTVVLSTPANRPPSAVNWIPWGPEPDGLVLYRHMLGDDFPNSAQAVAASPDPDAEIVTVMGDYFPCMVYCSKDQFDLDRCGIETAPPDYCRP
ncbi:MAG: hypothetical protein ACREQ9_22035 [Candidatus Binatia bacterium]